MEDIATQTADAQVNLQNSIKNYQTSRHGIKIWQELKDFVNDRGGNVLDLGIGEYGWWLVRIIIGGAFSAVITSFVTNLCDSSFLRGEQADILTPPLGLILHGDSIDNFFIVIQKGRTRNATYHTPQEAAQDGAVYHRERRSVPEQRRQFRPYMLCALLGCVRYVLARRNRSEISLRRLTLPLPLCTSLPPPSTFPASNAIRRHQEILAARRKAEEDALDPPTKQMCPWCKGTIPYGAIRCQLCTSIVCEKIPPQYIEATRYRTFNMANQPAAAAADITSSQPPAAADITPSQAPPTAVTNNVRNMAAESLIDLHS
ncbi:hypothetical protein BC936DRAFT_147235 [Jimgerdemannia flammicorona]|uniref:Uncharacterized protein n=1 Tax=Jimgerdemannia flammicorona TaxID=994334 RepID=A0A433DL42_9FUNG|nr:hypothetical protein BC936DRAFT_147235 [Jimgerdemannia flammicorona]